MGTRQKLENTPRSRALLGVCALTATVAIGSCATYSDKTELARQAVQQGDLAGGEKQINRFLKVRKSEKLPTEWKKETALAVLERAMILQALGMYKLSARDFQAADKELELLDIAKDGAGKLGKYIFSDSATKYKAPPSEKLALNAFNMINYLALGDLSGARVEAKRFTVMRTYLSDYKPDAVHGAFGSYLAGFVYERLGETEAALRYYDEVLQQQPATSLAPAVRRLTGRSSFRSPAIRELLGETVAPPVPTAAPPAAEPEPPDTPIQRPSPSETEQPPAATNVLATPGPAVQNPSPSESEQRAAPAPATNVLATTALASGPVSGSVPMLQTSNATPTEILVVVNVGRVPYKVPERLPIGLAVGLASAYITGDTRVLERSAFKFVNFPKLVDSGSRYDSARVKIDGQALPVELLSNLSNEVAGEYEDLLPKIIGSAITRMITRALAAEGARAAGRQAEGAGAIIGFLA
ncbi:MAG: hypothetical protein ACPG4T_15085, partial [Nannocystaceae bacterium]